MSDGEVVALRSSVLQLEHRVRDMTEVSRTTQTSLAGATSHSHCLVQRYENANRALESERREKEALAERFGRRMLLLEQKLTQACVDCTPLALTSS